MPYPQHNRSTATIIRDSQRPPPGSHLSAWFHGESNMTSNHSRPRPTGMRKAAHVRSVTAPVPRTRGGFHGCNAPSLRPRASTLSVIDPVHSPIAAQSRSASTDFYGPPRSRYNPAQAAFTRTRPPLKEAMHNKPKHKPNSKAKHQNHRSAHARLATEKRKPPPMCFPNIPNPKLRRKSIGTLISGILLTLVLTTYLALATSNTVPTIAFHAIFILFILLLTIIFAHFLIRLCMLAFHPQPRFHMVSNSKSRFLDRPVISSPRPCDLPISRLPIRLRPPYHDEEMALPVPSPPRPREEDDNSEMDVEKSLPAAPPPAYGRWRGSVRVDPEHPDLQQLTRELVMAEAGWAGNRHRNGRRPRNERPPPSYTPGIVVTSDVYVVEEGRAPALAPAPLFSGVRRAPRNSII